MSPFPLPGTFRQRPIRCLTAEYTAANKVHPNHCTSTQTRHLELLSPADYLIPENPLVELRQARLLYLPHPLITIGSENALDRTSSTHQFLVVSARASIVQADSQMMDNLSLASFSDVNKSGKLRSSVWDFH